MKLRNILFEDTICDLDAKIVYEDAISFAEAPSDAVCILLFGIDDKVTHGGLLSGII